MEKNALGQGWLLGETIITGIGQGYIQTTIQLCLMTAQIGNGGHKIYPKVLLMIKTRYLHLLVQLNIFKFKKY